MFQLLRAATVERTVESLYLHIVGIKFHHYDEFQPNSVISSFNILSSEIQKLKDSQYDDNNIVDGMSRVFTFTYLCAQRYYIR